MTAISNPNKLIKANGELNSTVWCEFEVNNNSKTYLDAKREFQVAVVNMQEPPYANKSGKPNPVWVSWYKVRRQVQRNVALNLCKKIIRGEVKEYETKPVLLY